MANYNTGITNASTPGSQTALSLSNSTRRLYDFSDRIAELSPDESHFLKIELRWLLLIEALTFRLILQQLVQGQLLQQLYRQHNLGLSREWLFL